MREGASVVVADVSGAERDVAAELGPAASAARVDVSSDEEVERMVAGTLSAHGRLDVLCNNAGIEGELIPIVQGSPDGPV